MNIKIKRINLLLIFALCASISTFAQTSGEEYRKQGIEKQKQKDYQGAIASFSECIRLAPADHACYSERSDAYRAVRNYDAAISDLNKAIEIAPQVIYHYYRATTYFIRGGALEDKTPGAGKSDFDQGFVDINKAISASPNLAMLYTMRGEFYYLTENYNSAIADYTKAIELKPKDAKHYKSRAKVYKLKKDNPAALADYTKAIELLPNNAQLYSLRGRIYFGICDSIDKYTEDESKRSAREDARLKGIADFKKALEINPVEDDTLAFLEILEMP